MNEVRRIRKERGLSQQRLAELAGVDKVTIVHIEGGKVSPKVETLTKLADALGVEVADFFPKAEPSLFQPETVSPEQGRHHVDVIGLDGDLADALRQQREFRLQELDLKLERAGGDQERREEAYRNLRHWWLSFAHLVAINHRHMPEIPGPALLREGDITVERVREFARPIHADPAAHGAEIENLEALLRSETRT
jgi:transcriptional regulator with XRE-family HTH domain